MSGTDLDDAASAAIAASRALVGVAVRSLAAIDAEITLTQYRALVLLRTRGALNVGTLAQAKELITRMPSPQSRREVSIALSPTGRTLVDTVTKRRRRELERILGNVDTRERRQIVDAFELFARAAGEAPDDAWKLGWT
jgi:DNA-binding MarR family transcriptional regulator